MAAGLVLVLAALVLTGYNLWDENRADRESGRVLAQMETQLPSQALNVERGPDAEMPTITIEGNKYIGRLAIPALDLEMPVMSEWSYPKLKKAPCRYSGTVYAGNMIIAGHNYRRHFGRLNIIRIGTAIQFTDVEGNVYSYKVADIQTLKPTAVAVMQKPGGWDLTLFTCTFRGSRRVTVRCVRTDV